MKTCGLFLLTLTAGGGSAVDQPWEEVGNTGPYGDWIFGENWGQPCKVPPTEPYQNFLWEQDAAGSNPVSLMRSKTSPQLVFKPSRKGRFFYCSPCSSKLLERASHYAVAPEIPRSPPSSRSQRWTTAISTDSTLTWPPTSRQGPELKLRLLSHPRICNKLNPLSQFA